MDNKWKRGYPRISLVQAIERLQQIYDSEYNNSTPREVMATAMGYSGVNGASAKVLSALGQYGLIEQTEEDLYKVSDTALNIILHKTGEEERAKAVSELAFKPDVFAELKEKYPNNTPSDDNIKAYLVKSNYHPKAVKDIIKSYKETLDFLNYENKTIKLNSENEDKSKSEIKAGKGQSNISPSELATSDNPPLVFKISRDSNVQIYFDGKVSQKSIEKLIQLLDLSKDTFPTEDELKEQEEI